MGPVTAAPDRRFAAADALLGPYVPTLIVEWLRDEPQVRHRAIDCTLVFADVSGFTRMTELLGSQGKIGAEEMAGIINGTFEPLLRAAYVYGAGLIKWGGDATLLMFQGADHVRRGARAAVEMQRVMRDVGGVRTSRGPVRLRMSIGVHSDRCDFFLVGHDNHRELLVAGPAATTLALMEKVAEAGQIVVSTATADALVAKGERRPTTPVGAGWLLRGAPRAEAGSVAAETVDYSDVHIGVALSRVLRDHVRDGGVDSEHRHATIGFVRFSGVDDLLRREGLRATEAALDRAIRAIQSATEEREVTFLATDIDPSGGKVMLSAGAPRQVGREEDRMLAALRAAIDAGGPLPLHAGVAAGRAFAGDYGPPHRRTYSLMGDCVNTAARLMTHAGPGELYANGEAIQGSTSGFAITPREPIAAKGKRAPVAAFSVGASTGGAEAPAGRAEIPPLVGRDHELAALVDAATASASGTGRVVELVGEPGMGKSRLLAELCERTGARIVWSDGDVYAGARPYAAFERVIAEALELSEPSSRRLASRLRVLAPQLDGDLRPWLPLVGLLVGLELPATQEMLDTDATARKERLEAATSRLLAHLVPGPAIFVFNDVHLMDDASRELIGRLAADAAERRWLIIVTRRPEGSPPVSGDAVLRLELEPLGHAAAEQLLAYATRARPLPPHRLASLAERAAGNPMFLGELAAQLSEGGEVEALPRSIEGAIAARIDRLQTTQRRILRAAAVVGMDVEVELLEEVMARAAARDSQIDAQLGALDELLEPVAPGRRRFSHHLVREVAYDSLPYRRRAELHSITASVLEEHAPSSVELLSLHCLQGARFGDAWSYARRAAQRARERYANAQAAESMRCALAAADHVDDLAAAEVAEVEESLGAVCIELGELAAADRAFRRALRRVRELPLLTARLQLDMAKLRDIAGRHEAAMRWAARAAKTLSGQEGPQARLIAARLATRRARISYRLGRHRVALRHAAAGVELARAAGDRGTVAEALEYGDLARVELGLPAGAGAQQALAIYEELGELGSEARVRNTLGMLAYHRGAWSEALDRYSAAEDAWVRSGKHWDAAIAAANAAEILADQGRLEAAEAALERAMLTWRGVEARSEIAFGEYQLGRIAARLGRHAAAMDRFAAARGHFLDVGELTEVVVVDALTAEALALAGEPGSALELADGTLARAQSLGGVASVSPLLHRVRGISLLALNARNDAARALRESLQVARARGADHEVAFTLRVLLENGLADGPMEADGFARELSALETALAIESKPPVDAAGGQMTRT